MTRSTIVLGLMQAATRGHDPVDAVAWELGSHFVTPSPAKARDWIATAEQATRPLTRGDVLWTCIAPIPTAWLRAIPLYALPYGTGDRTILRPLAVFIGDSPRRVRHQRLIWYALREWARSWGERQPLQLVLLAKRDNHLPYTSIHVYAPDDAQRVQAFWRSEDIHAWQAIVVNPDRPKAPATYRPGPPAHTEN